MSYGLVIITDGRADYLARMMESLKLRECPQAVVVVDDSGDERHHETVRRLTSRYDGLTTYVEHPRRRGLAAAVQSGWRTILETERVEYVLHLEDDFTFPDQIPVAGMRAALAAYPFLSQVVLKRQPWNAQEIAAGGIIEANPERYWDFAEDGGPPIVLHRNIFSLNPCLIPRRIIEQGWPDGNEAEQTVRLCWNPPPNECHPLPDPFAFYGTKADPPRCIHIGARRAAGWTL